MQNATETLFNSEKLTRHINRKVNEILVDQLIRDDLELDVKEQIVESIKKGLAQNEKTEADNSKYWYKYGLTEGKTKGIYIGGAATILGFMIGKAIFGK